jgi:hypothetical protein
VTADGNGGANGNMPVWARVVLWGGFPAIIAAFLLGMIPGVRSPFDRIEAAIEANTKMLAAHDRTAAETLRVYRIICRGTWKDNAEVARQCGRINGWDGP